MISKQKIARFSMPVFTLFQMLFDLIVITAGAYLSYFLLYQKSFTSHLNILFVTLVSFSLVANIRDLYYSRFYIQTKKECFELIKVWCISFWLITAILLLIHKIDLLFSVVWFAVGSLFLFGFYWLARWTACLYLPKKQFTVAFWGVSAEIESLVAGFKNIPWIDYNVVGFYATTESPSLYDIEYKGSMEQLLFDAKSGVLEQIYIVDSDESRSALESIVKALADTTCSVMLLPNVLTFNLLRSHIYTLNDVPIISIYDTPFSGISRLVKRLEDIILSLLILIFISPILLVIYLLVKITSKGPVIFKQDRYGVDGKIISVWKFRSMKVMENDKTVKQATKNDPRFTPIGSFLRKTSLDELPQFINVLLGDMSIVGPRPHAIVHNEEYRKLIIGYMQRHKVKPGITGWAQINGYRGETDTLEKMEKRVEYDLDYIRNWSITLDLKIIFLTIFKGFSGKTAY